MHNIRLSLRSSRRRVAGFTLIELMITVAIIAILVRIAYPIYTQSVLKSRRADAKSALLDLASREERYFGTANAYTATAATLGYATGATLTAAAPLPILSGSTAYYNLSVLVPDPAAATTTPSFIATATPVNSQTNDKCGSYTLTQAGVQGVTGGTDTATNCW